MKTYHDLRAAMVNFEVLPIGALLLDPDLGLCEKKSLSSVWRLSPHASGKVVKFAGAVKVFEVASQV